MRPVHSPFWHAVIVYMRGDHVDLIERLALACAASLFLMMAIGMLVNWQVGA